MEDKLNIVKKKAYPTTIEGIAKFYNEWAPTIDDDLVRESYSGPRFASEKLAEVLLHKDANVMDMACGTGLVADQLKNLGFKYIDGVDISEESLKISEKKGLYRRLILDRIGTNRLDINDDFYDGLVCSGAFAVGHLNQECLPEWIRIVKPGGFIVFNVASDSMITFDKFKDGQLEADLQELTRKGSWEFLSHELCDYLFGNAGHLYVFKVLKK